MKISQLPEPVRSRALEYQRNADMDYDKESIFDSFCCLESKEGFNYWNSWHNATEVTPELLKMHYKNAKRVRCMYNDIFRNVIGFIDGAHVFNDDICIDMNGVNLTLYDKEKNQLAEIISYKEEKEDELTKACKSVTDAVKKAFPSVDDVSNSLKQINTLKNPEAKHYELWKDFEAIDVIKLCLTEEEYKGFLKGNLLKYKLRDKGQDESDKVKARDYSNELRGI